MVHTRKTRARFRRRVRRGARRTARAARTFLFGRRDIPLTQLTFPGLGGLGAAPSAAGLIGRVAPRGRAAREILPFIRGLNVQLGRGFRGLGRVAARTTGISPFRPLRLGVAGLIAGAAKASPRLRRGIRDIPTTIFGTGGKIGEAIEAGGVTPKGITPLGVLGAGVLGALGIGGAVAAGGAIARGFRERRERRPRDQIQFVPSGIAPSGDQILTAQPVPGLVSPLVQPTPVEKPPVTPSKPRRRRKRVSPITNIIQNQITVGL